MASLWCSDLPCNGSGRRNPAPPFFFLGGGRAPTSRFPRRRHRAHRPPPASPHQAPPCPIAPSRALPRPTAPHHTPPHNTPRHAALRSQTASLPRPPLAQHPSPSAPCPPNRSTTLTGSSIRARTGPQSAHRLHPLAACQRTIVAWRFPHACPPPLASRVAVPPTGPPLPTIVPRPIRVSPRARVCRVEFPKRESLHRWQLRHDAHIIVTRVKAGLACSWEDCVCTQGW